MANVTDLVNRVRLELGDMGKSFIEAFVADGTTDRFRLPYSPLDATTLTVVQGGTDVSSTCTVEESTGVIITNTVPADGTEMVVTGTYYRYFTGAELARLVTDAVTQHASGHTDSLGRAISVENLPLIEEYPVSIYAVTLALYTLATDASFDIDIAAPDGVSIPRSERYRQLMDMVQARQVQYRDLCVQLGVGMYKIDVFTLRRQSKATGRLIPVYKPQEVDDRSYPQRVHDQLPTYGDKPIAWPTNGGELTAYQNIAFSTTISLGEDYTGFNVEANLLSQRGSVLVVQSCTVDDASTTAGVTSVTFSLTAEQTIRLANRTYWSISYLDVNGDKVEIKGGNFFTLKAWEAVL
jgi:hypothetical protein